MYNGVYVFEDTILNLYETKFKKDIPTTVNEYNAFSKNKRKHYIIYYKAHQSTISIEKAEPVKYMYSIVLSHNKKASVGSGSKLMVHCDNECGSELLGIDRIYEKVKAKYKPKDCIYLPFLEPYVHWVGMADITYYAIKDIKKIKMNLSRQCFKIIFPHGTKSGLLLIDDGFIVRGEHCLKEELTQVS
jgi:hypothetical protein